MKTTALSQSIMPRLPLPLDQPLPWLGGLTATQFMKRHWQKKPLFVKGAFAKAFAQQLPIDQSVFFEEALADALPVRLVSAQSTVTHGPLTKRQIPSLKRAGWTILIQQFNSQHQSADDFLNHFRFLPEARLDDLMISYASDRGGIGAHVDSYDVFLIQAQGKRLWELARDYPDDLVEGIDLKVLKHFQAEVAHLCEPGDLLYLPPGVAHRGVAVGHDCMTYSVGFRAPDHREIADAAFGQHLDRLLAQPWSDPWLSATDRVGELPDRLVKDMADKAMACMPDRQTVCEEVVIALSVPHPTVLANLPKPISYPAFVKRLAKAKGLALAPGARLMTWRQMAAANGEPIPLDGLSKGERTQVIDLLNQLGNERRFGQKYCDAALSKTGFTEIFFNLYLAGVVLFL
ncbi:MAG: cupin domain-containing protein [Burkholderiaceae bacterium]